MSVIPVRKDEERPHMGCLMALPPLASLEVCESSLGALRRPASGGMTTLAC